MKKLISIICISLLFCNCSDTLDEPNQNDIQPKYSIEETEILNLVKNFNINTRSNDIIIDKIEKKTIPIKLNYNIETRSIPPGGATAQLADIYYITFHKPYVGDIEGIQYGYSIAYKAGTDKKLCVYVDNGILSDTTTIIPLKNYINIYIPKMISYYKGLGSVVIPDEIDSNSYVNTGELINTKWHQKYPYNKMCGVINSKRCLVGCCGIAAAQIIAYCGKFSSSNPILQNINFSEITRYAEISLELEDITATFIYDVAVNIGTQFGTNASSSNLNNVYNYLNNKLNYICSISNNFSFSKAKFYLENKMPIIARGENAQTKEGHEWIMDGIKGYYYKDNAYDIFYHCNWGWGKSDSWLADIADPDNSYFSKDHKFIFFNTSNLIK